MTELKLLSGKRILIVEDEYFLADDVRRALEKQGAIVVGPVSGVIEGLELVRAGRIDAAILDVDLDGVLVYPIADLLDEQGIPFVFATALDRSQIPGRFKGYVLCPKPTELQEIAEALFTPEKKLN